MQRYLFLREKEANGAIERLAVHPSFDLLPAFVDVDGKKWRGIRYEADFSYRRDGRLVVEDFKGVETPVFRLKRKLLLYHYQDLHLRVVKVPTEWETV